MRTTGKKQTFVCIDIEFIGRRKVALNTPHHIDEALEGFGKTLKGNVVNLATSEIFTIIYEAIDLDDERKDCYHSINANILWVIKQSQP